MTRDYDSVIPGAPSLESLRGVAPLAAFASQELVFIEALSAKLMHAPGIRAHPELTALAFWMRKSNVVRLEQAYHHSIGERLLVPRGTAFHIAPSNIDTIFVYSWIMSLLSGNRNIVRLSSRRSAQSDILTDAITQLLSHPEHAAIASRTLLLRYPADDTITTCLSAACDVRVIWGGDATVEQIRRLPLPPTAIDIAFPNKYSMALIRAAAWLTAGESERASQVQAFWNDAYWFDQMACSSPRLVLWVGSQEEASRASDDFWSRLDKLLMAKGTHFADSDYVNKLVASDSLAINNDVRIRTGINNSLVRVWLDIPALHVPYHCGAGLFFESSLSDLAALRPLLSRTVQTICYSGWHAAEMREFAIAEPMAGIDRIVPFGRALDFAPVWDGFDLTRVFMREITVA